MSDTNIPKFKVIIVGNSSVGKSSVMLKFIENRLATVTTTNVDIKCRMLELQGKKVELEIWDSAGMERFHAGNVGDAYYQNAQGIMIVYDITDEDSFKGVDKWLQILDEVITEDVEVMILGNKTDLNEGRVITTDMGIELSTQHGALFQETSAENGININRAFNKLATALLKKKPKPLSLEKQVQDISINAPKENKTLHQMNINAPININSHNQYRKTTTNIQVSLIPKGLPK